MKLQNPSIILARIDDRLKFLKMSATAACKLAGIGVDSIRDMRRKGTIPKRPAMEALADVLEVDVEWLYGRDDWSRGQFMGGDLLEPPTQTPIPQTAKRIPIVGIAYGSLHEATGLPNQPIGWVEAPVGLRETPNAYAIYVDGDSMSPQHNPGDLRFVDPNRPCRPGDSVIIRSQPNATEPVRMAIKRLVSRSGEEVIADQINPKRPATITFSRSAILSVDRVLTTNELFGV